MKILSRTLIIIFFLFLISHFSFLISPAFAQTKTTQENNFPSSNTKSNVPNTLHNWTQTVMIETMSALTCQIAGIDPINPKQSCLGADQKTGKIDFLPSPQTGGAIGFMGNMIATLYTPPLHTADYFQNLAQNFGITKKTYAQQTGTGFQSLTPLIGVWSAFRNIVYLFLVIVFVVIGLAIMLRVKIDPRTVMTIQNQIPKIIIGILAVTFSFAIAGFLIDMMWVLINLISGIMSGVGDVTQFLPARVQGTSALGAVGGSVFGITNHISVSMKDIIKDLLGIRPCSDVLGCVWTSFNPLYAPDNFSGSFVDKAFDIISFGAGFAAFYKVFSLNSPSAFGVGLGAWYNLPIAIPAGIAGYTTSQLLLREFLPWAIAYLIIFVALLTALFRLWFTLLMAYVQILLAVVLAPFWIIGGIIPGSPISLSGWLKDIGANLLAFPVTIAMFMLGKVFMNNFGNTPAPGVQPFVPPLVGNPGDPSLIGSLIALGILLMTPNVVNMLKAALKAPKTDMGGAVKAIGEASPMAMFNKAGAIGLSVSGISGLGKGVMEWPLLNKLKKRGSPAAPR